MVKQLGVKLAYTVGWRDELDGELALLGYSDIGVAVAGRSEIFGDFDGLQGLIVLADGFRVLREGAVEKITVSVGFSLR